MQRSSRLSSLVSRLSFSPCLCITPAALLLVLASPPAQSTSGPTIAPLAPSAVTQGWSPLFNAGNDGIWNLGEGKHFDTGGVVSQSHPTALQRLDIRILKQFGATSHGYTGETLVGELRPPNSPSIEDLPIAESSFEITVPVGGFPDGAKRQNIVLLLSTTQTSSSAVPANRPFGPHIYPGDPDKLGLWQYPFPGSGLVEEFAAMDAAQAPFYVVTGHIVPRTSHMPLVFTAQRLRELAHVMEILLNEFHFPIADPPLPNPHPTYVRCVAGTSFGGLTTQAALLLWPDEFHSGVAIAFNGSLRALPEAQNLYNYLVHGLGFGGGGGGPGAGYSMRSAVDWTIFARLENTDFLSLSTLNRAHSTVNNRPMVLRPMILMVGDEDPVAHGQEWVHSLAGTSGFGQPYSTRRTFQDGSHSYHVDTLVIGKSSHGGEIGALTEPYQFPGQPDYHTGLAEPIRRMVFAAYEERNRAVPPHASNERKIPKSSSLVTADPMDKVFHRKGPRTMTQVHPTLLVEAGPTQGWNRFGRGTTMGIGESMKVAKLTGDSMASIFVGSADGLITRYRLDPTVPWFQPLVEMARSAEPLGYGVYALAVGEVGGSSGLKVVAGSYRRIGIYNATDLSLVTTFDLPDFEHTEPMRIQIGDLHSNSGNEIVFRTLHGRIVVMSLSSGGQLSIVGEHSEGGVQDLVIGPSVGLLGSEFTNGLFVLSSRGHVAGLSLHEGGIATKEIGRLEVASALQYGVLHDLDMVGSQLVMLAAREPSHMRSIRVFNAGNLSLVTEFGTVHNPQYLDIDGEVKSTELGIPVSEPNLAVTAQGQYVVLYEGHLMVFDYQQDDPIGVKRLSTFGPSMGACGLAVGDVDGDGIDEVVVSTASGRVVWFEVSELLEPGLALTSMVRDVRLVGTSLYDHRTNPAISSTWGFARGPGSTTVDFLHAIDPSGGWWILDPLTGLPQSSTGRPSLVFETGLGSIRGLSYGGAGSSGLPLHATAGSNDTYYLITPNVYAPVGQLLQSRLVVSKPYSPLPSTYTFDLPYPNPPVPSPVWFHTEQPAHISWDDFWLFPYGGKAMQVGNQWQVASWAFFYPNLVQQFRYSLSPSPQPLAQWASTGTGTGALPPTPTAIGAAYPDSGRTLRSSTRYAEIGDLQTAAIGRVIAEESVAHTIVAGTGGRVIVLDGTSGVIRAQSEDLGIGGMALAVADLNNDGVDEILFAAAVAPVDAEPPPSGGPGHGGHMRAYLHVLKYEGGTNPRLVRHSTVPIGDPYASHDLHGFGACGIAVADLDETGSLGTKTPEVLVTTLNGEFVVFAQTGGVLNPVPLFRDVLDGQLGAFNSIVVGDLDNANLAKPEVYIATSTGVRKFYVQ